MPSGVSKTLSVFVDSVVTTRPTPFRVDCMKNYGSLGAYRPCGHSAVSQLAAEKIANSLYRFIEIIIDHNMIEFTLGIQFDPGGF